MNTALNGKKSQTIQEKRALLAERLRKAARRTLPLSFAQQRLWFLDQLEPNTALYNVPTVARLTGKLYLAALEQSLNAIVRRHEALRTQIICVDEDAAQSIRPDSRVTIEVDDVSTRENALEESMRIAKAEAARPFDLAKDNLIRVRVVKIAKEDQLLIIVMHHIVSDEWSLKVFFNELSVFYQGYTKGLQPSLPPLPIQYSDYAIWQRTSVNGELFDQQLKYWKDQLSGTLPATEFPLDHPRGSLPTFRARTEMR